MSRSPSCFEIVQFSFASGVGVTEQLAFMSRLGKWAQAQAGYIARQAYRDPVSNVWTDVIEWQTEGDAQAAMRASQEAPELAGVMSGIDPASVRMGHYQRLQ